MSRGSSGWKTWLLATAVAVVAVATLLGLFHLPNPLTAPAPATRPAAVTLARDADVLLTEEAKMRDPTPLFLPTVYNAGENALPAEARRELSSSFRGYPPNLRYDVASLKLALSPVVEIPRRTADVFETDRPRRPFIGFGQTEGNVAPLQGRTAFVEVVAAGDGSLTLAQPLTDANPPGDVTWQPLQFLVAIDASGVVGPPILTGSSQVTAVDGYFQDYLMNVLRIGERLRPGIYRVGIGP